jgi:hypothetical protein
VFQLENNLHCALSRIYEEAGETELNFHDYIAEVHLVKGFVVHLSTIGAGSDVLDDKVLAIFNVADAFCTGIAKNGSFFGTLLKNRFEAVKTIARSFENSTAVRSP